MVHKLEVMKMTKVKFQMLDDDAAEDEDEAEGADRFEKHNENKIERKRETDEDEHTWKTNLMVCLW